MERTTKAEVLAVFNRLCINAGRLNLETTSLPYADPRRVGGWYLDYAAVYGGYAIAQRSASGGISMPFGHERLPAREFVSAMHYAIKALEIKAGK